MANTDSSHLFCLADNDAFGFDLDCTLAMFNLVDSFKLTHDSMVEYLIEEKGYSQALREDIEVDVDFCTKGLVLDQAKGNFLKLAYDGSILRACHGTRVMSIGEIEKVYGKDKQFGRFDYLKKHVTSEQDHFRVFENYFDVPGSVISAKIADIQDKAAGKPLDNYSFWDDVFAAFINCYRYQAFSENSGGFFPGIKTSPKKYYRKCSDEVKHWVKSLRSQKKFVFLMTSSYPDFGKHTLQQVFGDQWQSYFDLYLFYARKPSFFTTTRPFLRLDGDVEKEPVVDMEANQCYSQGNVQQLNAFLAKVTGKTEPKVVYFGDSLRSDVFPAKSLGGWNVVHINEEMEAEGYTLHDVNVGHDEDNEDEQPRLKRRRHEAVCESTLDPIEKKVLLSEKWGSLFTDDVRDDLVPVNHQGPHRHMNTFWGWVISQYSDIAIPNIEYIAELPLTHKFKSFRPGVDSQDMLGFHPGVPLSLQKYEDQPDV